MTDVHFHQAPVGVHHSDRGSVEATELAAFEKGRMQGEMEAIRRLEAEQGAVQLKQFPVQQAAPIVHTPDVLEINRLTNLQRAAAILGEMAGLAYITTFIVWVELYRGSFGWSNDFDGDNIGNVAMWNTHLLTAFLGLFCLSQAILMYRILPLNMNPWINRAIYCFWQACAVTCFMISLAATVQSTPDATFWGVENWCFALALAVSVLHSVYSVIRTLMEPRFPVTYELWSETNNKLTLLESPEQRRDHSQFNQAGRTVYTPAPVTLSRHSHAIPHANANVGAQVPVAPGNAPRWAENPNTHAENYFLMPRAKWAICGFFGIGASILMILASVQHVLAAGRNNWAQRQWETTGEPYQQMNEVGNEAAIIGATGILTLASVLLIAYAAMPPRTTLVKNGILTDATRRASISHNAETRIGHHVV